MDNQFDQLYDCVTIESFTSFILHEYSLFIAWTRWIKKGLQSYVFDDVRNKLVSAHCTVTLNVLTVTDDLASLCSAVLPLKLQS